MPVPDTTDGVLVDPFSSKPYKLKLLAEAGTLKHYRIYVEGTLLQSTDIIFTRNTTTITGDLCPGFRGVVSSSGYGEDFFSRERGSYSLSEKFLSRGFHPELAREEVDELWQDDPEVFEPGGLDWGDREYVYKDVRGMCDDQHRLYEWFSDREFDSEDVPGWGYCPRDRELLHKINLRFSRLLAAEGTT